MTAEPGLHGTETDATYDRAGFGGHVPRGPRPALVVVDLTRGFTEPAFATGADLTAEIEATNRLVDAARAGGAPVVWTVISYSAAEVAGGVAWLRKLPSLGALRDGSDEVVLDPRLHVRDEDPVIVKKGASGFHGTSLAALLAGLHTTTAVICGATTSGCIRATAVDAVQSGFDTLVVADACGDRAKGPHDAALFDLAAKYGDVVELEDAATYLSGSGR